MPDEVDGYKLYERIGAGGMGEVYKAYNPSLHRWAAIKILHQDDMAERFRNEASIQSSVNHPNIVRLYEFKRVAKRDCIVMEYVEGETLDVLLRRKGKLSADEVRNIISQLASALAYLHKNHIIHRDIKPQNIKIQPDGKVKMLDFGIAKNKLSPKLTQVGFVVGTMEYLAPEQLANKPELKSDIWALGVMCYELITGYMPFESTNTSSLHEKIRKGNFTDPQILVPDLPSDITNAIDRCLRTNPTQRISANGVLQLLGNVNINREKKEKPELRIDYKGWIKANKNLLMGIGAGVAMSIFIGLMIDNNKSTPSKHHIPPTNINPENSSVKNLVVPGSVLISVPGVEDAVVVLPDGTQKPLPYRIEGNEGDTYEFIIHANGYKDKNVEVQITPRRSAFEYHLEKINE